MQTARTGNAVRGQRGFTLIELMIVIAIIVVLTAYAIPNVMGALQTEPIKAATNDVMDVFQYSKVRSANNLVAYGVAYDPGLGTGGGLEVYRGQNPSCASVDWLGTPIQTLAFGTAEVGADWGADSPDVRIIQVLPNAVQRVCFTPDGRLVRGDTFKPLPATDTNYGAGEFIISLARYENDIEIGLRHHVIVSYSGRARFTFGNDPDSPDGEGGY